MGPPLGGIPPGPPMPPGGPAWVGYEEFMLAMPGNIFARVLFRICEQLRVGPPQSHEPGLVCATPNPRDEHIVPITVVQCHLMPLPLVTSRRLLLATLCRRVSMSTKGQVQAKAAADEPALVQYYLVSCKRLKWHGLMSFRLTRGCLSGWSAGPGNFPSRARGRDQSDTERSSASLLPHQSERSRGCSVSAA